MGEYFEFAIWCDGERVATCSGPDRYRTMANAGHYAFMYSEDGPVEVKEKIGRRWVPVTLTSGQGHGRD